ncbi:phosphoribosylanthranilate isomerase [Prevotella sp. P6B1]|uniref:phosphoribosylanthranilate isomerase n=1 Tax=Prevotella sp. P6B1 TaxID=1410613 RepID=UPI0009DCFDFC|nr:phosphoribosylanthranilate isomerase [Prevotella sp. P6B1]
MKNPFLVKICGMREADNIREVERLGIDMMGFIFWPKSSRYVSEKPAYLPIYCNRVGVFVDEDIEVVKRTADEYALDIIQLHGHERPDYIKQLSGYKVIKAFNIATAADFALTEAYQGVANCLLFDTKGKSVGGNGEKFDWTVLKAYKGDTPFLLSGGIGPDDAERVNKFYHSKCIGIDLNSRFETAPGLKDVGTLKAFIKGLNI